MSNSALHPDSTPTTVVDPASGLDVRINSRLPHIAVTAEDGTVTRYVPIQAHLDLMDERDDYRRVTAMINVLRSENAAALMFDGHGDFLDQLTKWLARVGQDDMAARGMRMVIDSLASGDLRSGTDV